MYDIKLLEDEWERYRKKKKRPWYILLFVIFMGAFISIVFLNYKEIPFLHSYLNSIGNTMKSAIVSSVSVNEPKADAMSKPGSIVPQKSSLVIIEDVPVLEDDASIEKSKIKIDTEAKTPRKKIYLNIIETSSVSAYKDVERRFFQTPDTDDALFLAKSYYDKGNYTKAEYWALQTNKVDDNIEESWLIFAKAKAKQGQINEAIRILTSYVRRSNSVQAKSVLYKIKKDAL